MSKSIYEEAIDDLTILLYDEFDDTPNKPRLNATERLDKFTKVRNTLEQAQKQEKLLELYKEALETNFEGITLIKLVNKTLRTQIKELENE